MREKLISAIIILTFVMQITPCYALRTPAAKSLDVPKDISGEISGNIAKIESMPIKGFTYSEQSIKDSKPISFNSREEVVAFGNALLRDGKARAIDVEVVGKPIKVIIEHGIWIRDEELREAMKEAEQRLGIVDISKVPDVFVIAILDKSSHLSEDGVSNGFIGVNRVYDFMKNKSFGKMLLMLCLFHETSHELVGSLTQDVRIRFEELQSKSDLCYAYKLLRRGGIAFASVETFLEKYIDDKRFAVAMRETLGEVNDLRLEGDDFWEDEAFLKMEKELGYDLRLILEKLNSAIPRLGKYEDSLSEAQERDANRIKRHLISKVHRGDKLEPEELEYFDSGMLRDSTALMEQAEYQEDHGRGDSGIVVAGHEGADVIGKMVSIKYLKLVFKIQKGDLEIPVYEAGDKWFEKYGLSGNGIVIRRNNEMNIVIRKGLENPKRDEVVNHELIAAISLSGAVEAMKENAPIHFMASGIDVSENDFDMQRLETAEREFGPNYKMPKVIAELIQALQSMPDDEKTSGVADRLKELKDDPISAAKKEIAFWNEKLEEHRRRGLPFAPHKILPKEYWDDFDLTTKLYHEKLWAWEEALGELEGQVIVATHGNQNLLRMIESNVPAGMVGYYKVANLPPTSHREGPELIDHVQACMDVLDNAATDQRIPAAYRNILSDPNNRQIFDQFVLLHDIGKGETTPTSGLYQGHEAKSAQMLKEEPRLANGLSSKDRGFLIALIELHGEAWKLCKEGATPESVAKFVETNGIKKTNIFMPYLIACSYIDNLGCYQDTPSVERVTQLVQVYDVWHQNCLAGILGLDIAKVREMTEKNAVGEGYGVTIVSGYPFSEAARAMIDDFKSKVNQVVPETVEWRPTSEVHGTVQQVTRTKQPAGAQITEEDLKAINIAEIPKIVSEHQGFTVTFKEIKLVPDGNIVLTAEADSASLEQIKRDLVERAKVDAKYKPPKQGEKARLYIVLGSISYGDLGNIPLEKAAQLKQTIEKNQPSLPEKVGGIKLVYYSHRTLSNVVTVKDMPLGRLTAVSAKAMLDPVSGKSNSEAIAGIKQSIDNSRKSIREKGTLFQTASVIKVKPYEEKTHVLSGAVFEQMGIFLPAIAQRSKGRIAVLVSKDKQKAQAQTLVIEKLNEALASNKRILVLNADISAIPGDIAKTQIKYIKTKDDQRCWMDNIAQEIKIVENIVQALGKIDKSLEDEARKFQQAIELLEKA